MHLGVTARDSYVDTADMSALILVVLVRQAVVYSEGILYLDDCDFSGSLAPVLVRSEGPTPIIRNAVLGDNNCEIPSDGCHRCGCGKSIA